MSFSDSLREQIARQSRDVLRFLTRRVGAEDAADLAQEAVLRVLRHAESGAVANPASLLHITAANLAKDLARRRRTESKYVVAGLTVDDLVGPTASPIARLEAEQSTSRFFEALDALPPRRREVFIMRRFENLHQEEIARRLGISRNMVEKHLRAAFKELKEALK
ncbi:RNA polymerase sigma factor [Methylocystis sp. Sn-Cys]|uniref:RNA polymerase sigma factor n=1 Tax=Methylocystis sp. Sn-Cys TaxID=1701263 RepID=UPI00192291EB|nr:RNA polymerase sigma factor [Methylocystis sp. Sn-Cys]MBL1258497.1 RNA polymerase sigma factor [Methylocystis sp. Sn-Cys]